MMDNKLICKDCAHLKSKPVGIVTTVFWCGISKGFSGNKLGVQPWKERPHPKCPLKGAKNES